MAAGCPPKRIIGTISQGLPRGNCPVPGAHPPELRGPIGVPGNRVMRLNNRGEHCPTNLGPGQMVRPSLMGEPGLSALKSGARFFHGGTHPFGGKGPRDHTLEKLAPFKRPF